MRVFAIIMGLLAGILWTATIYTVFQAPHMETLGGFLFILAVFCTSMFLMGMRQADGEL
jgi:hypothetical protein